MILPWIRVWCRKEPTVIPCENLNHEVRNALLGIHLERRRLWKAFDSYDKRVREHMTRIEEALKSEDASRANG